MSEYTHAVPTGLLADDETPSTVYAVKRALRANAIRLMGYVITVLAIALVAVLAWTHSIYKASMERTPLIFGLDQKTGAVSQLRPESIAMPQNETALRSAIEIFVKQHYERLPVLSRRDYNRSLWAMAKKLTGPEADSIAKDLAELKELEQAGHTQEVEIEVVNSTITGGDPGCSPDNEARPCLGTVYFTKRVFNASDHSVIAQKPYIATMTFYLTKVKNELIQVNPFGLLITDLHTSEGHAE